VIPESYLDEMGHMNVMWYTHLFSGAVGGLFKLLGLTRDYFESNRAGSFALEFHVRFLAEVRAGKHITIRTRLLARSAKRLHFISFMTVDQDDVLAATEEAVGTHVDMTIRRSAPYPAHIADRIDWMLAEHLRLSWEAPLCGVMKP
jgi:acyl-CoA thioester hydrolase